MEAHQVAFPWGGSDPLPYFTGETPEIDRSYSDWEFVYKQSSGEIGIGHAEQRGPDVIVHHRLIIGTGYSGAFGRHQDNPASEHMVAEGPIPRGRWAILPGIHHRRLGPTSIPVKWLDYQNGKSIPGDRSGFYIHGDNASANRTASTGCIILPKTLRLFVEEQRKRRPVTCQLVVIA